MKYYKGVYKLIILVADDNWNGNCDECIIFYQGKWIYDPATTLGMHFAPIRKLEVLLLTGQVPGIEEARDIIRKGREEWRQRYLSER